MATWHEDDSHGAGCAMHVVASAECTCGKLDALGQQDDRCYHVNGGERTGFMSGIEPVGDDIGVARRAAQDRADTLLTGSVWLTTGHPSDSFAAVLETFPATRVAAEV